MEPSKPLTALITGANRGIGYEIARQLGKAGYKTLLGARDAAKGSAAADKLRADGLQRVEAVVLDVADVAGLPNAVGKIESLHGAIDVLVNNAAILIDAPGGFNASLFEMTDETMRLTWETNVMGPAALLRAVLPGMIARGYGRVVNMSSLAGQLSGMGAGFPAYRVSKAAVNALTRIAASEAGSGNIKVNSCSPGWVRTEMGGPGANRSVIKGAETPVWLAMLPSDGPTGGFFHDKTAVPW